MNHVGAMVSDNTSMPASENGIGEQSQQDSEQVALIDIMVDEVKYHGFSCVWTGWHFYQMFK